MNTLLSIAEFCQISAEIARVLLNKLMPIIAEESLLLSQCGIRANRGMTDLVFVIRQLQGICQEQIKGLYATFAELIKAFDSVSRTGHVFPESTLLSHNYSTNDDPAAREPAPEDDGGMSELFPIANSVKQGLILAPTLFSIVLLIAMGS